MRRNPLRLDTFAVGLIKRVKNHGEIWASWSVIQSTTINSNIIQINRHARRNSRQTNQISGREKRKRKNTTSFMIRHSGWCRSLQRTWKTDNLLLFRFAHLTSMEMKKINKWWGPFWFRAEDFVIIARFHVSFSRYTVFFSRKRSRIRSLPIKVIALCRCLCLTVSVFISV